MVKKEGKHLAQMKFETQYTKHINKKCHNSPTEASVLGVCNGTGGLRSLGVCEVCSLHTAH